MMELQTSGVSQRHFMRKHYKSSHLRAQRIAPATGSGIIWVNAKYYAGDVDMKPIRPGCFMATAALLLGMASHHSSAADTYYHWLDQQGNPVNSDRPPPMGIEYEVITVSPNLMRQVNSEPAEEAPAATPPSKTEPLPESIPKQTIVVVKNPEACKLARQNLHTLNTFARIRVPDGQGNFRFIGEEEKAAQRKEAEATIEQNCE
jgi:hypothetical protein